MNKVILIGRLTRDPNTRYSQGESSTAVTRFTLAVDRRYKGANDNQDADFVGCTSFGKTAEFIEKYFRQGMKMAAVGRIQTGSYTNNEGQKVYTTDVIVEEVEFCESKNNNSTDSGQQGVPVPNFTPEGFMNIPDGIDGDLPFN